METDVAIVQAARRSALKMADRTTPFIFDCWYVAGFANEFGRTLRQRTLLGRPLVLFRTEMGMPVALSDRCIHRSYPLSRSRLHGDHIVCGYHGLRYDASGRCVEAPAQPDHCPKGVGVRSYALRERGPLIWIWMGDGEADGEPPLDDWIDSPEWPASSHYYHLHASYVALHENLLDLTHLSFLHASTFGTPDFAAAPYALTLDDKNGSFKLVRTVSPTRLPPVWAEPLDLVEIDAVRCTTSEFISPAVHVVTGHFYAVSKMSDPPDTRIRTSHLPTPESATSTHYFIVHARNFAVDDADVTNFMHRHLAAAFEEDIEGLRNIENMLAATSPEEHFEISLASDRAGVAMRRWLYRRASMNRPKAGVKT